MEIAVLRDYLGFLRTSLGAGDPTVKSLLNGRSPEAAARQYVTTSKLKDVAERKRLAADRNLVLKSDDGMIRLARLLEEPARKLLKKHEETIEALEASSSERIAQYRFRVYGVNDYPDATLTPRVAFGIVKAYRDKTEAPVPYATTLGGLSGAHRPDQYDKFRRRQFGYGRWL